MKKKALIKSEGLGYMITKAMRNLSFNQGHSVYKEIEFLQNNIKKLDELLPKVSAPGMREKMLAARNRYQSMLDGRTAKATRLKAQHDGTKQTMGTVAGVGAGVSLAGAGGYAAYKLNEPDMDAYKLAEDWVQGFIIKCAAYNIDGQAWLDKILDEVEKTGTIKNAQWGKLLGGLLGGGALYGGGNLYRRYAVNARKEAIGAKGRALQLNKEREADLKKMLDTEQGNYQYQPTYQAINEVNKIRASDADVIGSPAWERAGIRESQNAAAQQRFMEKNRADKEARRATTAPMANPPAGLPTGDIDNIPPMNAPPPLTLNHVPGPGGKPVLRPIRRAVS